MLLNRFINRSFLDFLDEPIFNVFDFCVVADLVNLARGAEALITLFVSGTMLLATVDCFNQMRDLKLHRSNYSHCVPTKVLGGCVPEVYFVIKLDLGAAK